MRCASVFDDTHLFAKASADHAHHHKKCSGWGNACATQRPFAQSKDHTAHQREREREREGGGNISLECMTMIMIFIFCISICIVHRFFNFKIELNLNT